MEEKARLVVGIDGSESSRGALRWALAEARLRNAPLEVLHAWRTPMLFVSKAYAPELVEVGRMDEAALRFIDRELDAVGADGDRPVKIERTQVEHSAPRALIEASSRADVVVLGRHGLGGFPHELAAPKVVQVAHHADCAVAVVPDAWQHDGSGVVVGIDGSDHSSSALRWAASEASRRRVSLTAVMAWGLLDQHHVDPRAAFDPHYGDDDARAALEQTVATVLGDTVSSDASGQVVLEVVNDLPAPALVRAAAGAELLVVGARGLGGFGDLLLGSVSHRCLTHAMCPTVVVRG